MEKFFYLIDFKVGFMGMFWFRSEVCFKGGCLDGLSEWLIFFFN